MRWPFMTWLRGAPGGDDPAPGAAEAAPGAPVGAPSAAPDPGPGSRVESRPAAWRELPPVQRTVGAAPLTAPSAAFARDLASRRAPDPILRPLGHDVTSDGPAGLVSGITVPLVQRAPSGSDTRVTSRLPSPTDPRRGRPAPQRGVTTVAAMPRRGAADTEPGVGPDAPGLEDVGAEASVAASSGEPAGDAPGPVLRALPVTRLAMATPAIAATRVADATAPLPIQAQARVIVPAAPPEPDAVTSTPLSATAVVPGDATAAEAEAGSPPHVTDAAPTEPSRTDDHAQAVVARRTLGESRRLGLGVPLVGPPPSAARETGRFDLPVARRARTGDTMLPTTPHLPALPSVAPAAAAPAPLPRLVIARRLATASATTIATVPATLPPVGEPAASEAPDEPRAPDSAPSGASLGESMDAAAGVTPADAAHARRPMVGESPIGVARLAREAKGTEPDAEVAAGPSVDWRRSARVSAAEPGAASPAGTRGPGSTSAAMFGAPASAGGPDAGGFTAVQRATAAPASGGPPGPVRPSPTRSATPALAPLVAARAMRSGRTASIASPAHRAEKESTPVIARFALAPFATRDEDVDPDPGAASADHPGAPSAPGVAAQREERPFVARAGLGAGRVKTSAVLPTLPLQRSASGTAWPDAVLPGRSTGAVTWTPGAGFTTVAPTPGPFVQRAVEIDEVTVTADAAAAGAAEPGAAESGGAAAAGQSASSGASAAAAGGAGTDYEEIAEHVYDRIRARLTTELLLDRERAGTLVDG